MTSPSPSVGPVAMLTLRSLPTPICWPCRLEYNHVKQLLFRVAIQTRMWKKIKMLVTYIATLFKALSYTVVIITGTHVHVLGAFFMCDPVLSACYEKSVDVDKIKNQFIIKVVIKHNNIINYQNIIL